MRTPLGTLAGARLPGFTVYSGVPFASPPTRFRPPQPARPWTGVRQATHFAAAAMQPDFEGPESEDCLYLNVWQPEAPGPHPVLVWIHGGGFTSGRSSDPLQDGAIFARRGIVTVTVAYRLGVLGFLDLQPLLGASYAGSADTGLRDLIQALTWVQENIASFGGDPARVTVAGESAGAKLIGILMGTPAAAGLFQQAISESGGAERVATEVAAAEVAHGFGAAWTAATGSPVSALATAPAAQLMAVQKSFTDSWPKHFPLRPALSSALLPRLPVDAVRQGQARGVRLLIGTNRDESALFVGPHPEAVTAAELGNTTLAAFEQVAARYQQAYPQLEPSLLRIRELTAEEYFVPSMRLLQAHTQAGGAAYAYRMDWSLPTGRLAGLAYHSLELQLVWAQDSAHKLALASQVQDAWVSFIQTGTPASPGLPTWPPYTPTQHKAMILNTESHVEADFADAELALWSGVL